MGNGKTYEHYHNKGEQDYGKGEYNPPYSGIEGDIFGRTDFQIKCDKSYDAGYKNAKNQG